MYSTTADFYRAELEYRRQQRRLEGRPLFLRRAKSIRNRITDRHAA